MDDTDKKKEGQEGEEKGDKAVIPKIALEEMAVRQVQVERILEAALLPKFWPFEVDGQEFSWKILEREEGEFVAVDLLDGSGNKLLHLQVAPKENLYSIIWDIDVDQESAFKSIEDALNTVIPPESTSSLEGELLATENNEKNPVLSHFEITVKDGKCVDFSETIKREVPQGSNIVRLCIYTDEERKESIWWDEKTQKFPCRIAIKGGDLDFKLVKKLLSNLPKEVFERIQGIMNS